MKTFYLKLCIRYRVSGYKPYLEKMVNLFSRNWLVPNWKNLWDEALIDG